MVWHTILVLFPRLGRVAQWIRAPGSGPVGRGFESLHAR